MIAIIAGGRKYILGHMEYVWLDQFRFRGIVSGGASGADSGAIEYATSRQIPCKVIKADWPAHGSAAGPIRNQAMADFIRPYPDCAVILFPGGRGTNSMRNIAKQMQIPIFEFPA
jgi:hypothetical protein